MVSDQCVAMQRDGIFSESADRKHCIVRAPKKDELIPSFLVESKANNKILTDFFVVRVNDTTPKKVRSMFVHSDFQRENRPTEPQERSVLKRYLKNMMSKSEASWSQFADFHLLLYIAQEFDVHTALEICPCIRDRKPVPEGILMMIKELIA